MSIIEAIDINSICVFCSSSDHAPGAYSNAARELGAEIGRRGKTLVYGGTTVGLMGALALATSNSGGRVIGVVPRSMVEIGIANHEAHELIVTETLRERKGTMDLRADAFVAMPGGIGTLEEVMEILTLKQLRVHTKPIVLLNTNGFYDPLIKLLDQMIEQRMARPSVHDLWAAVPSPNALFDYLDSYVPPVVEMKWT